MTRMNADTAGSAGTGGYVEYAPVAALRAYVECFWCATSGGATSPKPRRVLPDGCVDIIVESDGARDDASVVGTMTRAIVVQSSPRACYVGVRFRPGAARAVLGVPAAALTDLSVPLAELWRDAEAATESVVTTSSLTHRLRAMQDVLLRRLGDVPALGPEVQGAVRMILRANGNLIIGALGPALGVTRQHLARSFARDVGITPKMLARVARVRAAVARFRDEAELDWSTLALDLGYYDQSHFVHDVKELTGLTPGQWSITR